MESSLANANGSSPVSSFAYGFLPLFYLVPPHHTYFKSPSEVTPYVQKVHIQIATPISCIACPFCSPPPTQATPYFLLLILIESVILWYKTRKLIPINDGITSISGGLIMQIFQGVVLKGFEVSVYVWIYDNFSLIHLPWDSPFTWWVCFIVYDFLYYWFHRMAHGTYRDKGT